ncbi:MAG: hypothetical protein LBI42_04510 [Chitinispirillales bacterium]|jgi:hypothetical protein|nr:hypothetical protein [Chitinispirillales bacterium]
MVSGSIFFCPVKVSEVLRKDGVSHTDHQKSDYPILAQNRMKMRGANGVTSQ